jgi:YD repeat-containing protein
MNKFICILVWAFFPFCLCAQSTTYTYDAQNRLEKVVYPSGKTVTYTYDINGNRKSMTITGGSSAATVAYSLNANWNMVSMPVSVANPAPTNVFPTALANSLNAYEGGGYVSKSVLATCKGYWIKVSGSGSASVSGTPTTSCTYALAVGWNMIAAPNCTIPLSAAQVGAGVILTNTLYQYNGSYISSSQLEAGKAYWIKATATGNLTLTCGNVALSKTEESITADLSNFGELSFSTVNGFEKTLYFGANLSIGTNIESFSLPPIAPNISGLDVRFGTDRYLQETSPEATIQLRSDTEVQVNLMRLPNSGRYALLMANGEHQTLKTGKTYTIPLGQSVRLIEVSKDVPQTLSLSPNYPNPFNQSTELRYSLPEEVASVKMRIYDSLGRVVQEWNMGSQEAGYYQIQWDGKNQSGLSVSAGTYIYELEIGQRRLTQKITKIR